MNKTFTVSARPELDGFESYKPGLSMDQIRRQFKLKRVIKLASNENPLGPSPKGAAAAVRAREKFSLYPESTSRDLRAAIAEKHGVEFANVIVGAGSDEIIELLAKSFLTTSNDIIVSESSFMQYRIAGRLMGARVQSVPLAGMTCDLGGMLARVTDKTKFIFLANPNNPTGTYNNASDMNRFLKDLPDHVLPVIDEAYFEYAAGQNDYPDLLTTHFAQRPLVVLRTFSKAFGLAGLRVGYGIAPAECVRTLDKIRPPFNVSIPAQAAGLAALADAAFLKRTVGMNDREKARLARALQELGFPVVPSAANFLLFRVKPWSGRALFTELLRRGVIVRSVDEYDLPDYLRVTVGTAAQNKIFLTALREVVKKK